MVFIIGLYLRQTFNNLNMKKNIYLAGLMLLSATGFAQKNTQVQELRMSGEEISVGQRGARASEYNDTIWHSGFETMGEWSMATTPANSTNGWEISSVAGTNTGTWYFQNGRIASSGGGNYAVIVPDAPSAATMTEATMTTASAIDISGYQNLLVLSYEKYGARFIDTLRVEVSNDGTNWLQLDDNSDFPINSTTSSYILPNPTSKDLFLPASIVNGDSLWIRFNWDADNAQPGIGYGFFIDDVLLSDVNNNDLALDQTAFFDDVRILYSWYFGAMPERQAAADTFTFSATYFNRGKNAGSNDHLELVVSGQDNQTFMSNMNNTAPGMLADTVRTTVGYSLTSGIGTYNFTWNVVSDSTDDTPLNNSKTIDLDVTGNIYSMAPYPVSAALGLGKAGTASDAYTLSQDYYMMTADTIYGVGVAFDSEWSKEGVIFQVSVIDANDAAVVTSDFLTVTAEMITDQVFYVPVTETPLAAGTYSARFEVFSADSLFLVSCIAPVSPIEPAPGGGYFSRTTLSYGGSNFIEDMAYLTLKNNDNITCNTTTNITGNVDDATEVGSITLNNVSGVEGPVYTYEWSGPNGYTSTNRDLSGLTSQGAYTVTITDVNRCTAVETFNVAGIVSVENVELSNNVKLFPNPNNGQFVLALDGLKGEYNVIVRNVLGQNVYGKSINVNGAMNYDMNMSNLEKGVYFVEVSAENNAKTVIRFIVE